MTQQTQRITAGGLEVAKTLYDFVNGEVLPGTGVDQEKFWEGFGAIVAKHTPRNRELLAKRDDLQAKLATILAVCLSWSCTPNGKC